MVKVSRAQQALSDPDGEWADVADGDAALRWFRFGPDRRRGDYRVIDLLVGDRHVQVAVSPSGRSVQVFVDGEKV